MGNSLENLLSIKMSNFTALGRPKDSIAFNAALILLPVNNTSSTRTTVLFSIENSNCVELAFNTFSDLLKSSLKK